MNKNLKLIALVFMCMQTGFAANAYAQQNVESVLRLERRDFDERVGLRNIPEEYVTLGFNYKGFQIRPEILSEINFTDNIFAEEEDTDSDIIVNIRPSLTISKAYGTLETAARIRGNIERFKTFKDDNKEEFATEFGFNYEPNSKWNVPFNIRYNKSFRDRGNPQNASILSEPTSIEEVATRFGAVRNFNRLSVQLLGKYNNLQFEDGTTQDTGTPVIFSDNDRSNYGGNLRFSYLFPRNTTGKSGHLMFLDLDLQKQAFENNSFQNGAFTDFKRDNTTYNAIVGFATSYKGLLEASVGVGYLSRDYDSDLLDTVNSVDFIAEAKYAFTPKFTLDFQADRFISQSTDTQTGLIETEFSLGADYEIYHNLYWRNNFAYKNFDFTDLVREDDDYKISTNLQYFLNRNFYAQLGLSYQDRRSNVQNRSYDRSMVRVSLTSKL